MEQTEEGGVGGGGGGGGVGGGGRGGGGGWGGVGAVRQGCRKRAQRLIEFPEFSKNLCLHQSVRGFARREKWQQCAHVRFAREDVVCSITLVSRLLITMNVVSAPLCEEPQLALTFRT